MKTVRLIHCLILTALMSHTAWSQSSQIDIDRVKLMPNLPSPYLMRDWKTVALVYDSFIFNIQSSGQYLPLMHLKAGGTNYPAVQPILLDSYVGSSTAGTQAEAINVIPSVVGASLVGVDKSNQFGKDWVSKTKEFYNKANGQNIYLNGSTSQSGSDWWYDVMPNVFFYQLYSLYPTTTDYDKQFSSVANRWLQAVQKMGGSTTPWTTPMMDYRGFNFSTMTPTSSGITEPEAAGSIAWLLYHYYKQSGDRHYLYGAELSMRFLSDLSNNPAYEIQLPYGTLVAAKMNAEVGTNYDIKKMLNWSFDQSSKRNWGTIIGTWGNSVTGSNDVSGLVGEIDNPATGYAFAMNGFQQAAALVPLIKYDKRFARTIAKWTLNVANASRLFYSKYIPASHQDSYAWSSSHDPKSVIAYEALKQKGLNDSSLYATGDAIRGKWAQTNLGIYGSSHVGYLGSIIQTTNVDGILLLDVNKTDFFGQNTFPSYVIYNPYNTGKSVTLPLGSKTYDIYDAITESTVKAGATGNYILNLSADQVMMLVYLPQGATPVAKQGRLLLNDRVVDYHYGYDFTNKLYIQSFASKDSILAFTQPTSLYASTRSKSSGVTFKWYVNNVLAATNTDSTFQWTAPGTAGKYKLTLTANDGTTTVKDSLLISVVDHIPVPPTVSLELDSSWHYANDTVKIVCHATSADKSSLTYTWSVSSGTIIALQDSLMKLKLPTEGLYYATCTVKNSDSLSTQQTATVLVKQSTQLIDDLVAYYPFDGDVLDHSGNGHDATLNGVESTTDALGRSGRAYKFTDGSNIINVPNAASLNFQNQITLSFWVSLSQISGESYIISHGSYQQRYKVSITPNGNVRWTVKTTTGITDLDSSFPLTLNKFYHITAVYTGYSMELYIDGKLNNYSADSGLMGTSTSDITFGRVSTTITNYSLRGTLDEVKIYDTALGPNEIRLLPSRWSTSVTGIEKNASALKLYPNPTNGICFVESYTPLMAAAAIDLLGREHALILEHADDNIFSFSTADLGSGIFMIRLKTSSFVSFHKLVVN